MRPKSSNGAAMAAVSEPTIASSSNKPPISNASRPSAALRVSCGKRSAAVAASCASLAARRLDAAATSGRLASSSDGVAAGAAGRDVSPSPSASAPATAVPPWAVSVTIRPTMRARSLASAARRVRVAAAVPCARSVSKPGLSPARSREADKSTRRWAASRSCRNARSRSASVRQSITAPASSDSSAIRTAAASALRASASATAARSRARRRPNKSASQLAPRVAP